MVYRETPRVLERKQARRRKLLHAAIRLFGRKGYHATTVPMIVRASGISTGTFYLYFRDKEDIFAAALEELGERISAAINQAMAAASPDVLSHMQVAVKALVRFLADHPQEARILIVESSGLGKRLDAVRRRIIASHSRGVGQALGAIAHRLPPLETAVVARCWVGAVYEAVFCWLEQPAAERLPAERLANAIADFNLRGIGAPPQLFEEVKDHESLV
jgi:TetR/AcrR family transcriptional regulator, fatty acid metabolism regulator protein